MTNQLLKAHCEDVIANPQEHLDWVVSDEMAMAFHRALSDSALGSDELEEIKTGLRAALFNYSPPVASEHPDKQRMDWLVSKCVEVREPLRYGSAAMFHAQAITDEEDDHHATKLREQIDEAIRASGYEVKS